MSELAKPIRTLKIICGALIAGVVIFGIILSAIIDFEKLHAEPKLLVLMAAGFGMVMFMTSYVMFGMLSAQTDARSDDAGSHLGVMQTAWIVRFAIIESASFLNLIVTMIQDSIITLFVAVLGILLMVVAFPRNSVIESLLRERMK